MSSKGNPHSLLVGVQTSISTLEISVVVSQKMRINLPQDPAIPLLGIYPKDAQSYHKIIYSTMFIAALFVIARPWKHCRCPSTEEWIKKVWHIYTLEYYSAVKNNDILNFVCKWMKLENIILNEVTQAPQNEYGMYSFISGYYKQRTLSL